MHSRFVPFTARIYTDMGSVFAKQLASTSAPCVILSHQPNENRIKAKTATLRPTDRSLSWTLRTTSGTYEFGREQGVRLYGGGVLPVSRLKPGDELFSCEVQNSDGYIFIQSGKELVPLHELVESDIGGILSTGGVPSPSTYMANVVQKVIEVKEGPLTEMCEIVIDCATPSDLVPESGHNFMMWPDGTSFGSGIFAC